MTRKKVSSIFSAIVVAVLFSFTAFAQEAPAPSAPAPEVSAPAPEAAAPANAAPESVAPASGAPEESASEASAPAASTKKGISRNELQAQNRKIAELKKNYNELKAQFDSDCKGKTFSAGDSSLAKCKEISGQLTTMNAEIKAATATYNKNLQQFKENNAEASPDAIRPKSKE
jgi:hypothetical protein